jgi:hypothetical protein
MMVYERDITISETWFAEWLALGFGELDRYLGRHAAFAAWLAERGEDE